MVYIDTSHDMTSVQCNLLGRRGAVVPSTLLAYYYYYDYVYYYDYDSDYGGGQARGGWPLDSAATNILALVLASTGYLCARMLSGNLLLTNVCICYTYITYVYIYIYIYTLIYIYICHMYVCMYILHVLIIIRCILYNVSVIIGPSRRGFPTAIARRRKGGLRRGCRELLMCTLICRLDLDTSFLDTLSHSVVFLENQRCSLMFVER